MKKNKENMEKLVKQRTKINPPGLDKFLEIANEYYPRMKTISTIDFADRVFSEFIRLTNARDDGMVQCITCKQRFFRTDIQNGHYKKRSSYKYRFDPINCHPQCNTCNVFLNGNYRNYHIYMVDTYGEEIERKIREDTATKKLYDYDLIIDTIHRYDECQVKKQIITANQRLSENSIFM